jgi:hypothetical protein
VFFFQMQDHLSAMQNGDAHTWISIKNLIYYDWLAVGTLSVRSENAILDIIIIYEYFIWLMFLVSFQGFSKFSTLSL